jgi:hypothetical protein
MTDARSARKPSTTITAIAQCGKEPEPPLCWRLPGCDGDPLAPDAVPEGFAPEPLACGLLVAVEVIVASDAVAALRDEAAAAEAADAADADDADAMDDATESRIVVSTEVMRVKTRV